MGDLVACGGGRRLLPLAVAIALVLSACTSGTAAPSPTAGASASAAASHKQGGTLTLSIGVDPNHIDPSLINAGQGSNIASYMAQTLTTYFYTGKLAGLLATKWTPNADLTAWTFTL